MGSSASRKFELQGVPVTANKSPHLIRCSFRDNLELTSDNTNGRSPHTGNRSIQGSSVEKDIAQESGPISEINSNGERHGKRQEKHDINYLRRGNSRGTDGPARTAVDAKIQTPPENTKQPAGGDMLESGQIKMFERLERKDIRYIFPDIDPLIKETLASYTDRQLYTVTEFYRQRLQEAIEEFVEIVSVALLGENMVTNTEHQKIQELVKKGERREASNQLFNIVIEHGAPAGRAMWVVFVKFRDGKPKLKNILTEIYEKGSNLPSETILSGMEQRVSNYLKDIQGKHRESLRAQNERLQVSSIQGKQIQTLSLCERYTELIVIANVRERRLVEHELWARGRDHEEWQKKLVRDEVEKIRLHQLFRDCFGKSSLGGTAVVSGVAGIGKTTMVQKIVHEWAAGRMYAQFNFVFHFKFRDLNAVNGRTSLKALILDSYPYFEGVVQHLWADPESILFIFDGLDEFKDTVGFDDREGETERACFDPECHCELSDIVRCLVQQKVLNGCSVLITSRPHALDSLERTDVNLWVEILGFFAEERREYFNKFYESVDVAADVFRQVEQNEILYTMCYNPSYCWILCSSLAPIFSNPEGKQQLPRTITQLFTNYIYNILNNHGREVENARDVLLKTGEMALEGVSRRIIVFDQNHFDRHRLQPSKFVSGFMMEILEKDFSATSAVYTFIHLTIQEYLAALSPYLKTAPENLTELLEKAESQDDGRFDIFIRFMVGLSAPNTSQQLVEILGNFQYETACQVKLWLTQTVKAQLSNTRSKKGRRKLLNTFHYVFESQDNLARFTGGSRLKVKLGHSSEPEAIRLNPVDCFVLATVLAPCDTVEELDLNYCDIQAEGIERLAPILHKCKILRLLSNNLTDSGMTELSASLRKSDCKIQILELNINGLTDNCAEELASALSTNQSLTELDLQRNRFRSGGPFCQLIKACTSLQKISLSWNQFSGEAKKDLRSLHESRPGLAVLV